jgi:CheY-like chemotaxis protein
MRLFFWQEAPRKKAMRVLIVDDNPDVADTTAELVTMWGYQTEVAYDGPSALKIAGTWLPDAGLLDLGMPGMDGYSLVRNLRQRQPTDAFAAFLAITAYSGAEIKQRCSDAGFDVHLVKPVRPALLKRALETIATAKQLFEQAASARRRNAELRQGNAELQQECRRLLEELRAQVEHGRSARPGSTL